MEPSWINAGSFWLSCTVHGITCTFITYKHNTTTLIMMMMMIIIIILDFEKIRPNLWHQILRFISSYFQRNSAIFSAFYIKNWVFEFVAKCASAGLSLGQHTVWSHGGSNQEVSSCGNIYWVPSTSLSLLAELFTAQMERDSALQIPSWLKQGKDIPCMWRFYRFQAWFHSSFHAWKTWKRWNLMPGSKTKNIFEKKNKHLSNLESNSCC